MNEKPPLARCANVISVVGWCLIAIGLMAALAGAAFAVYMVTYPDEMSWTDSRLLATALPLLALGGLLVGGAKAMRRNARR